LERLRVEVLRVEMVNLQVAVKPANSSPVKRGDFARHGITPLRLQTGRHALAARSCSMRARDSRRRSEGSFLRRKRRCV